MTTLLLSANLFNPPPRQELVPRPRLIELLDSGLYRKLYLISAGAGATDLSSLRRVAGCSMMF
jgi:ATP/maltotriose-dependent transcriptional regulator MalT